MLLPPPLSPPLLLLLMLPLEDAMYSVEASMHSSILAACDHDGAWLRCRIATFPWREEVQETGRLCGGLSFILTMNE